MICTHKNLKQLPKRRKKEKKNIMNKGIHSVQIPSRMNWTWILWVQFSHSVCVCDKLSLIKKKTKRRTFRWGWTVESLNRRDNGNTRERFFSFFFSFFVLFVAIHHFWCSFRVIYYILWTRWIFSFRIFAFLPFHFVGFEAYRSYLQNIILWIRCVYFFGLWKLKMNPKTRN